MMKLTKKQLIRIIKEEKTKLVNEYGQQGADRAMGLYFDVNMQKQTESLLTGFYNDAISAAMKDLGDQLEAKEMVNAGMRKMFEDWLNMRGPTG